MSERDTVITVPPEGTVVETEGGGFPGAGGALGFDIGLTDFGIRNIQVAVVSKRPSEIVQIGGNSVQREIADQIIRVVDLSGNVTVTIGVAGGSAGFIGAGFKEIDLGAGGVIGIKGREGSYNHALALGAGARLGVNAGVDLAVLQYHDDLAILHIADALQVIGNLGIGLLGVVTGERGETSIVGPGGSSATIKAEGGFGAVLLPSLSLAVSINFAGDNYLAMIKGARLGQVNFRVGGNLGINAGGGFVWGRRVEALGVTVPGGTTFLNARQ